MGPGLVFYAQSSLNNMFHYHKHFFVLTLSSFTLWLTHWEQLGIQYLAKNT